LDFPLASVGLGSTAVQPPSEGDETFSATVFVPEASVDFFDRRIEAYRDEDTKSGKPKNEALVARIEDGNTRLLP
jgi:hypothetical protein